MRLSDFNRLIDIIKRKIYLLIGRAILTAVNNDEKTMKIQVTGLNGETITDIERMQEYGFESYPKTGSAESVVLFPNGNRDRGFAICVHDREYRPTDLAEGEVRVYDWNNNKITLTDDGIKIEDKNNNIFEMKSGEISITGSKINLLGATESFLKGDTFDTWLSTTLKASYDTHTHTGVTAGGAVSGPPALPLTAPSNHLSSTIKGE